MNIPLMVKVVIDVTPTLATGMGVALGAVLEGFMPVANIIEEVDLVFSSEQRRANTVYRGITPPLL